MPTSEQRLDQMEPVLSEMLARQDETAAKVERVSAQLRQLTVMVTNALTAQSDNIGFLLNESQKVGAQIQALETAQDKLSAELADFKVEMRGDSAEMKEQTEKGFQAINQRLEKSDQRFDDLMTFPKGKLN